LLGTDAGESARFGLFEVRWALYPAGDGLVRLSRQIPYTVVADIMFTGRHIDAAEARQLGLIGQVVPDGKALETARQIAASIAANGSALAEISFMQVRRHGDAFTPEPHAAGRLRRSTQRPRPPRRRGWQKSGRPSVPMYCVRLPDVLDDSTDRIRAEPVSCPL
jgi:enoyl-CoA hydratase/carnithine racemase